MTWMLSLVTSDLFIISYNQAWFMRYRTWKYFNASPWYYIGKHNCCFSDFDCLTFNGSPTPLCCFFLNVFIFLSDALWISYIIHFSLLKNLAVFLYDFVTFSVDVALICKLRRLALHGPSSVISVDICSYNKIIIYNKNNIYGYTKY